MQTLFLDALLGKNKTGTPPIWLFRQAGRYMSAYRKLREKHSFLDLCTIPELIASVTLQPIEAFKFDAAIIFSDILLPLKALGFELEYDEGPKIYPQITNARMVSILENFGDTTTLPYVSEGIRLVKKELKVPLIGFIGCPFTIASYLIEGSAPKNSQKISRFYTEARQAFHKFLDLLTTHLIAHAEMQIQAGADVIQLFESSAFLLDTEELLEFSVPYMEKIVKAIKVPSIVFMKGGGVCIENMSSTAISLDQNMNIAEVRKKYPHKVLQGNLPPELLLQDTKTFEHAAMELLNTMKGDPAYIFNLGHGVLPSTGEEKVRRLVEIVRSKWG